MRPDRAIKIICIICLSMTVGALVVARNSPAVAYEPSIYTATPLIVWLALFINLVCGIGIVIYQVGSKRHTKDNLWLLGILLILMSYTILLSLWIIRGYALWGDGDPLVHLSTVYNLISSGHISSVYPVTHILLAQIATICGISPTVFHNILPLVFGLSYPAFMYLLAKSILPQKGQIIMAMLVSVTFIMMASYIQLTPNRLANLALPLALFILIKSFSPGTIQWKLLFIIMIFLFPVFHSVPTFLILITLLTIWVVGKLPRIRRGEFSGHIDNAFGFNFTASVLLVVWGIFWLSPHGAWAILIHDVGGLSPTLPVERSLHDLIYIFVPWLFNRYGGVLIYIIFALAAIPILIKRIRHQPDLWRLASLYGSLAICSLLIVVSFFARLFFNPFDRLQVYVIILCTPFVGFVLYEMIARAHQTPTHLRKMVLLIVIVFLVALSTYGTARLYGSPFSYDNNYQITRTQIRGMDWFLHKKDYAMPIGGIFIHPGKLGGILLSSDEIRGRRDIWEPRGMIKKELRLPSHLGYDRNPSIGALYGTDIYLVLDERDRNLYSGPFHELSEFTFLPQDFERLKKDTAIEHIYSNGGLDVYFIRSTSSS